MLWQVSKFHSFLGLSGILVSSYIYLKEMTTHSSIILACTHTHTHTHSGIPLSHMCVCITPPLLYSSICWWTLGCFHMLDNKEGWVPKNWCFQLWCWGRFLRVSWTAQTSQSERKSTLNINWKDWCWSSNTLAIWSEELTHWKRPWCWERLKAKEGDDRGWNDWMDHQLNGHEFEQALIVGNGEGSLACCSSWGLKALNMTEWLKLTELNHWTNAYSGKRVAAKWMFIPKWLNKLWFLHTILHGRWMNNGFGMHYHSVLSKIRFREVHIKN